MWIVLFMAAGGTAAFLLMYLSGRKKKREKEPPPRTLEELCSRIREKTHETLLNPDSGNEQDGISVHCCRSASRGCAPDSSRWRDESLCDSLGGCSTRVHSGSQISNCFLNDTRWISRCACPPYFIYISCEKCNRLHRLSFNNTTFGKHQKRLFRIFAENN